MTAGRGIVHSERTRAGAPRATASACTASRPGWRCRSRRRRPRPASPITTRDALPDDRGATACACAADRRHACRRDARRCATLSRHALRRCACSRPAPRCRSMPTTRSARSTSSTARSRSPATRSRPGGCWCFRPGDRDHGHGRDAARGCMLLGGAPMDGPRHIWWNFVSSRKERIEQAKADWKAGRFDTRAGRRQGVHPAAGLSFHRLREPRSTRLCARAARWAFYGSQVRGGQQGEPEAGAARQNDDWQNNGHGASPRDRR